MSFYIKNTSTEPLQCNERYFINHIVTVIHNYPVFELTMVKYKDSNEEFIVDSKLLTEIPDNTHTISIGLLGGLSHDT